MSGLFDIRLIAVFTCDLLLNKQLNIFNHFIELFTYNVSYKSSNRKKFDKHQIFNVFELKGFVLIVQYLSFSLLPFIYFCLLKWRLEGAVHSI